MLPSSRWSRPSADATAHRVRESGANAWRIPVGPPDPRHDAAREGGSHADDPNDRGSAALEFILVGLLLLVPLVYLIVSLGLIQGQSLGAEAGARHVARAVATSTDAASARDRAHAVLTAVVEEYGIDAGAVEISMSCRPAGASCPEPGATVVVTVASRVALPLVPPVLGLDRIAGIPIEATAAQKVSRFWGTVP